MMNEVQDSRAEENYNASSTFEIVVLTLTSHGIQVNPIPQLILKERSASYKLF